MNCPRCGYGRVISNKLPAPSRDRILQVFDTGRATGRPVIAVGFLLGGAAAHLVNALRDDWRCDHCAHRFS
jgi:DNA-directed RNA polymerase subunit RPC12/RpoP